MSEENLSMSEESIVDLVFGGEPVKESHSQAGENDKADLPGNAPEAKEEIETFDPYDTGNDDDFADDSAADKEVVQDEPAPEKAPATADSAEEKEAAVPEKTAEEYQQEIANLNKRLHDTQKAYHERSERAADLQKRLEALENRKSPDSDGDEDDWFSEDDKKEVDALKQELTSLKEDNEAFEAQRQEIQQQANLAAWHQAAAGVRKAHPDFDKVVYEDFEPLLDEKTGDARIRSLYLQWQDKSPEGVYKLAKQLPILLEVLDNPDTWQEKVQSLQQTINNSPETTPHPRRVSGKEALRNLQSADDAEDTPQHSGSLVDKIFG